MATKKDKKDNETKQVEKLPVEKEKKLTVPQPKAKEANSKKDVKETSAGGKALGRGEGKDQPGETARNKREEKNLGMKHDKLSCSSVAERRTEIKERNEKKKFK